MLCYCSICRKLAGSGGYGINLGAAADTMVVEGEEHKKVYRAIVRCEGQTDKESPGERHFCGVCGSALWGWDPRWPELIHPNASAIDTPLPPAPEVVRIMLDSKANWVPVPDAATEPGRQFAEYPTESLADWHKRHGLYME